MLMFCAADCILDIYIYISVLFCFVFYCFLRITHTQLLYLLHYRLGIVFAFTKVDRKVHAFQEAQA